MRSSTSECERRRPAMISAISWGSRCSVADRFMARVVARSPHAVFLGTSSTRAGMVVSFRSPDARASSSASRNVERIVSLTTPTDIDAPPHTTAALEKPSEGRQNGLHSNIKTQDPQGSYRIEDRMMQGFLNSLRGDGETDSVEAPLLVLPCRTATFRIAP